MSAKIFIGIASLSVISTFLIIGAFGVNILVYSFMGDVEEQPIENSPAVATLDY